MNSDAPSWGEINSQAIKELKTRLAKIEEQIGPQYTPGGRCETCRHWDDFGAIYADRLGRCKTLSLFDESTYWGEGFKIKLKPDKSHELAFISGERYNSNLITKPSFSCTNYTPK